ncbi:Fic/DOC family protein [Pontibacter litorisediminis]|uniref:Fic/DOC family protein n=1 Tax=Pontibacter litorisediminis TaxID=1846260 RepID=UPI0023EA82ED|nr:Fic family protein [Pontibacter litorisediminis]
MTDPYCYSGTDVLINKFNIQDKAQLDFIELNHWRMNLNKFSTNLKGRQTINLDLWQRVHRETFGTVYTWAGEIRSVMISKGNAVHAVPSMIGPYANHLFDELKAEKGLKGADLETFLHRGAYYLEELNAIHPFREGNTRTIKVLFSILARNAGYRVDWTKISSADYKQAENVSFQPGRKDPPPFYHLLQKSVEPYHPKMGRQFKM